LLLSEPLLCVCMGAMLHSGNHVGEVAHATLEVFDVALFALARRSGALAVALSTIQRAMGGKIDTKWDRVKQNAQ
jgi:hypothetical protein